MSYSITNGHSNIKDETTKLANEIMKRHPNLVIMTAINATSPFDEIGEYKSIFADLVLISRCSVFICGKDYSYSQSSGAIWEMQFAKFLGKPVYTSDYLLGLSPNPLSWEIQSRQDKLKKLLENKS